jgi:hypothetical protein
MRRTPKVPACLLHKPSHQAIVVIKGKTFYLGRYESIESRAEYSRIIGEWLAQGGGAPPARAGSSSSGPVFVTSGACVARWHPGRPA